MRSPKGKQLSLSPTHHLSENLLPLGNSNSIQMTSWIVNQTSMLLVYQLNFPINFCNWTALMLCQNFQYCPCNLLLLVGHKQALRNYSHLSHYWTLRYIEIRLEIFMP